jgi:hypothetical protein
MSDGIATGVEGSPLPKRFATAFHHVGNCLYDLWLVEGSIGKDITAAPIRT